MVTSNPTPWRRTRHRIRASTRLAHPRRGPLAAALPGDCSLYRYMLPVQHLVHRPTQRDYLCSPHADGSRPGRVVYLTPSDRNGGRATGAAGHTTATLDAPLPARAGVVCFFLGRIDLARRELVVASCRPESSDLYTVVDLPLGTRTRSAALLQLGPVRCDNDIDRDIQRPAA